MKCWNGISTDDIRGCPQFLIDFIPQGDLPAITEKQ
jgi:hypothetical protein